MIATRHHPPPTYSLQLNWLLHIWPVRRRRRPCYPDVHYPPNGVYRRKTGAQVTSRRLTGNGP